MDPLPRMIIKGKNLLEQGISLSKPVVKPINGSYAGPEIRRNRPIGSVY